MMNLDAIKQKKTDIMNALAQSIRDTDEVALEKAMSDWSDMVQQAVISEAQGIVGAADTTILSGRGVRQLTSEEKKFYQSLIDNAKMDAQTVPTNINVAYPQTIIESVFTDIRQLHPLLDAINFQNTSALTEMIINKEGVQTAVWGALNSEITKSLEGSIGKISTILCKLTAYMFVTKDMLALGPVWVDKYIREILIEALATGLETGIVDGTGKDEPIGMTRDVSDDVTVTAGVYPRKAEIAIRDFSIETYGTLLEQLSKTPEGRRRTIQSVILLVNPADYFKKVMPATTLLLADGTYRNSILPFPTQLMQSVGVPEGKAVIGIASKYFMGLGSSKDGKIEYDDSYKFLEDLRTYTIRLYGNGRALDNNAFLYLDISALDAAYPVFATKSAIPSADLVGLKIDDLTLSPAFDRDVMTYTATATAASNVVTAFAKDGDATISIKSGNTDVTNGASASWTNNAVTALTVKVTNGSEEQIYTVNVTRGTVTG